MLPAEIPEAIPDAVPIAATEVAELVHTPPPTVEVSVMVLPRHKLVGPEMVPAEPPLLVTVIV